MVYALNKLSRATTKIESLGEQHSSIRSGLGFAAHVIKIGARTAYYVKMTASGSAAGIAICGPLAANPYGAAVCSIGGGVAGLTAAFGTEQVIASGLEKGIEETSKAAGRQGRTAEESEKFEQSVQNTAFYLGALGSIFGAKKVAGNVKSGGKGKNVQFADKAHAKSVNRSLHAEVEFTESGRMYGNHKNLTKANAQDSHHVIQHAAVKDIPGYNFLDAPTVQLKGPSQILGTEHQLATKVQRASGGGSYAAERWIGYKAMRKAGVPEIEARNIMNHTDQYFKQLKVKPDTMTAIPGNRKGSK